MRRTVLFAAAAALLCALGASVPDTVTRDKVTYARRGSLGADSYVATNVVVDPPGYQLARVADMKLRDRAVNFAKVGGANAVFALPGRKSVAGYARAFILYLDVTADGGAAIAFTGAVELYTTDWYGQPKVEKGKWMISLLELTDDVYLVEARELERIGGE